KEDDSFFNTYIGSPITGFFDNAEAAQAAYMGNRMLPSGVEGTDTEFSLGQAATALGTAINQVLNPFNPNRADQDMLDDRRLLAIGDLYVDNIQAFNDINHYYDSLSPEDQAKLSIL